MLKGNFFFLHAYKLDRAQLGVGTGIEVVDVEVEARVSAGALACAWISPMMRTNASPPFLEWSSVRCRSCGGVALEEGHCCDDDGRGRDTRQAHRRGVADQRLFVGVAEVEAGRSPCANIAGIRRSRKSSYERAGVPAAGLGSTTAGVGWAAGQPRAGGASIGPACGRRGRLGDVRSD
ncbi:unnamed protein product, partial [Urochloa humidicola]